MWNHLSCSLSDTELRIVLWDFWYTQIIFNCVSSRCVSPHHIISMCFDPLKVFCKFLQWSEEWWLCWGFRVDFLWPWTGGESCMDLWVHEHCLTFNKHRNTPYCSLSTWYYLLVYYIQFHLQLTNVYRDCQISVRGT